MRRQTPIAHLLYSHLFPRPTDDDPPSFAAHLAKNLVQEVRREVNEFYGELVTIEAKYPGLDYCYGPHRMRLGRFEHHRRLFAVFDELNLTYQEIQDFCCWEGTRWARERYEKDEGVTIVDTTANEIRPYVDRKLRRSAAGRAEDAEHRRGSITRKTDISVVFQDAPRAAGRRSRAHQPQAAVYIPTTGDGPEQDDGREPEDDEDTNMSDSASDATASPLPPSEETGSIEWHRARVEALERSRDAVLRDQLQTALAQGVPLTPEQEQMLKEQHERSDSQALDVARSVWYGQRALNGEASTSARAAA
ncbi:hypothetical protein WHR41_00096 [Cladosporium halotolerans]|uniref:Uncharacterized protein n=1 Tax=Cladosporium halotolerans TaxID=1052096 RepID=A0AB34L1J3_9PEZI